MNRIAVLIVLILNISCRTNTIKKENMIMSKSEVISKNNVELNADMVWKKLIAFGGTERFVPDLIVKVIVKGTGVGAIRNIYLKGGGKIIEELTKIDSVNQSFEFIILSTPMPIDGYTGKFEVNEISDNKCEVIFTSKFMVSSENKEDIKTIIKEFQITFISNLDK